jgi:hypothetical protein
MRRGCPAFLETAEQKPKNSSNSTPYENNVFILKMLIRNGAVLRNCE